MKHIKKVITLLLSAMMVLSMSAVSFGADNNHTITITNNDQHVTHSYEAYKVFGGDLDATESKLANITWGNGVDAAKLIEALQKTTATELAALKAAVASVDTTKADDVNAAAKTVAEEVAKFSSTSGASESAGAIDAFATIVGASLKTKAADFTQDASDAKKYTADVTGDGYYFIKDVTSNLNNTSDKTSDTLSKYLLSVVKDTTIEAKDTGITPNKTVTENKVKANSAAIGDLVQFNVEVEVPNTTKYVDNFWFFMEDQLPAGLTFNEVKSVKIGSKTLLANTNYTVAAKTGTGDYATYTKPADKVAGVNATGGQKVKVVFKDFKAYVEENNLIGEKITITYDAYVNKAATFGNTGNKNEVEFTYSTDPNHDYDGDEPGPGSEDPKGTTPKSETTTYVTALEILKVDGTNNNAPLEGAEFEITGTAYNMTLVTGEEYEKDDENGTYWKLIDGSYTTQDPETEGMNDTQYVKPYEKYTKKTINKVVTTPEDTKITVISGADGKINVSGLKPGTYTVKEKNAPDGYNKIDKEFPLVIKWVAPAAGATDGGFSIDTGSDADWTMQPDGALFKIQIQNNQGSVLPSTGGIGTVIFYVLGSLLVVGCGIVLISKKRMNSTK